MRVGLDGISSDTKVPLCDDDVDDDDNGNTNSTPVSKKPWSENVLSVLFTNNALTGHVLPIFVATHILAAGGIANFSLGLSSNHHSLSYPGPITKAACPIGSKFA